MQQASVVERALAALPTPWRVERHSDYDGYLSLVISSEDPEAPTFAVSGFVDQLDLSEINNDELRARGQFATIEDTVTALTQLLGRSAR